MISSLTFDPFDIPTIALGFGLTEYEVEQWVRDGRGVSFLIERKVCKALGGCLVSQNAGFDVRVDAGEWKGEWEVRCLTKKGVAFSRSADRGSGRVFDRMQFDKKIKAITGWAVIDVTKAGRDLTCWMITSSVVRRWFDLGALGPIACIDYAAAIALLTGREIQEKMF